MDVENCIRFGFMMAMGKRGLKKCSRLMARNNWKQPCTIKNCLKKGCDYKIREKMSKSFGREGREKVQINKVKSWAKKRISFGCCWDIL